MYLQIINMDFKTYNLYYFNYSFTANSYFNQGFYKSVINLCLIKLTILYSY